MPMGHVDWVLEMYSKRHPKELQYRRPQRIQADLDSTKTSVGWANVLTGKALRDFYARMRPKLPDHVIEAGKRARERWKHAGKD